MGYEHPPRAIADLKEAGVAISKRMVRNRAGRLIAEYTLVEEITQGRASRVSIPKRFRDDLNAAYDYRCNICRGEFEGRELQADHRIPFWIGGDRAELDQADYMPLCASDNRSKSWSCEHCFNFSIRDPAMCQSCFWAQPESYTHVAGRQERRVELMFQGEEVARYDAIQAIAEAKGSSVTDEIKNLL